MSEWNRVPLETLLQTGVSYGIVQPGTAQEAGVPIIRVKDVRNGRIDTIDPLRVSPEIEAKHSRTRLRGGEVLLTLVGSTGQTAIASDRLAGWNVARAIGVMRPIPEVSPQWLRYYLDSEDAQQYILERLNTTVQATLNLKDVRVLPVPLPPRREREAITAVAGALDDRIAVNERIAATAEDLSMTLVISESRRERVRLDEICSLRKDQVAPQELADEAVDHYSLPAFDAGKLPERVSPESIKSGKFTVSKPAVLLSKLNPDIPRVWSVIPDSEVPSLASTEFLVLAPRGSLTVHELWAVTSQRSFLQSLASKVTGTSKSHQRVRPAEVMATEVVDPRQFGEAGQRIRNLASRAALARQESQALAALRDTLLPQLMSGRLRVKDAEKIVGDRV
ncbi:restriction endonuclease subunit S [Streptomyces goshikiensis]|uniref:restriction endonuclease subunit S n=1 Tax=Streptomyces goshikiensis TaxID=1942 RepID=UPI0036548494